MAEYRTQTNRRLSSRLSIALFSVFAILTLVVGGSAVWMAQQHDRLASENTRTLVNSGFAGLTEKYEALARDYALWTELYDVAAAEKIDTEWLYNNFGTAASIEPSDVDIAVMIKAGSSEQYGWQTGGPDTPSGELIPDKIIRQLDFVLEQQPFDSRKAYSTYIMIDGDLWIYSVARIVTTEGMPAGASDTTLPRMYFGRNLSNGTIAGIGEQFLIKDISISTSAAVDKDQIKLPTNRAGADVFVSWQAPTPGNEILSSIVGPIGLVLLLTGIAITAVAVMAVGSARRLEKALLAAQAADRSKTEFLANVSHELRTPMNGVLGMAQVLRMGQLDDRQKGQLDILVNSAESQMLIINDLLEISKIENGTFELDSSVFHPVSLLQNIVDLQAPEAEKKGLILELNVENDVSPVLVGDQQALRQVITNIVGNAVKFTSQGRVDIDVEFSTVLDQSQMTLKVRDTGPGIAATDHEKIFERFSQADNSTTREVGGTGLGLAITKSIVDLMEGTITLESAVGEGSEFTVTVAFEVAVQEDLLDSKAA